MQIHRWIAVEGVKRNNFFLVLYAERRIVHIVLRKPSPHLAEVA